RRLVANGSPFAAAPNTASRRRVAFVTAFGDVLASADDLAAVYGPPVDAVTNKIIDRLDGHCRDFIARAPFVVVATADAAGNCDVSPKGGAPGFVQVLDAERL